MPTASFYTDDFLGPVSADQPVGTDLRWTPEWDRIKEARRADDDLESGKWAKKEQKAADWYQNQPWLFGFNFVPSTAVNDVEMWQQATFDAKTIDRELGWAQDLGFNTVRATLVGDQVSLAYQRMSGQTVLGMTAKVTVSIGDIQPVAGNDIDMTELVNGLPRGTVQRVESGGTTDFPLRVGKIHFNQEPVANADITGWFRTTLTDPAGRTLNGNFQAKVQAL